MFKASDRGFAVTFPNGWTASVQWGYGCYCENRNGVNGRESKDAEIAAFKGDEWHQFETDQVKGWCDSMQVLDFLNMVAAKQK